ncbi:hypothetical protein Q0F99_14000 [Rathayibacter oskolensis]|nr:hypothetical protein [Rathayibacter oskolensis]WKK70857.1 hypothetical protein Q0F99_14000 [Rathayibacter oskolensis]
MASAAEIRPAEATLDAIREGADEVGRLAREASPSLLASDIRLYQVYRAALSIPLSFARGGLSNRESNHLVERSIRAELAVGSGVSERDVAHDLERAHLLVEDLPATRAALAEARMRWTTGIVICSVAATLPQESLAEFDARAADAALTRTPPSCDASWRGCGTSCTRSPSPNGTHAPARTARCGSLPRSTGWRRSPRTCRRRSPSARITASTASPEPSAATSTALSPTAAAPATSARSPSCAPMPSPTCSATATSPAPLRPATARRPRRRSSPECAPRCE